MTSPRLRVADAEIVALTDAQIELPLSHLFPDMAPDAWEQYRHRYAGSFDASGERWSAPVRGFLVLAEERRILVDTGLGSSAAGRSFLGGGGQLVEELRSVGLIERVEGKRYWRALAP